MSTCRISLMVLMTTSGFRDFILLAMIDRMIHASLQLIVVMCDSIIVRFFWLEEK